MTYSRMIVPAPTLTPVGVGGIEADHLGVAADDGVRVDGHPLAQDGAGLDDGSRVDDAPVAELRARLDDRGGMDLWLHRFGKCRGSAGARARTRGAPARHGSARPRRLHPVREQVELRVLQQVVVLQDPDHLERVALAVVAVGVDLLDQVEQHRAERDDTVDAALLEHLDALRAERLGGRQRGKDKDLRDVGADAASLRGKEPGGLLHHVLLQEAEYLRRPLEHRRGEDIGVPGLHRHDGLVDERKLGREQEEVRLAARLAPGRVVDQEVDLLVARLAPRLHLVLADLADEEPVLLKELPDNAFVDGGHGSSFSRMAAGTHEFSPGFQAHPTSRQTDSTASGGTSGTDRGLAQAP